VLSRLWIPQDEPTAEMIVCNDFSFGAGAKDAHCIAEREDDSENPEVFFRSAHRE
jgi:hypothetical protein